MSRTKLPLIIAVLTFLISPPAEAQCPTTVRENLPLAANPDFAEWRPYAFPYPDGSTIAVFARAPVGNSYQIVDRYGYLVYPEPQSLWPAVNSPYTNFLKAIPDGQGGVLACWEFSLPGYEEGIYAQRVDSLGNICWGDSAKRIYPVSQFNYDIYADGSGGLFFTCLQELGGLDVGVIVQHIDELGEPMWGDSGSYAYLTSSHGLGNSTITRDDNGGAYVVWIDFRPPYVPYGALYMQHVDSQGNPTWNPEGIYICYNVWFKQVIPDGENGFLLHTNPGASSLNTVYRFAPSGLNLWVQEGVSRHYRASMVPGEPGFFYLGFSWNDYILGGGIYGQRMDMEGNIYWPTGSQIGALMALYEHYEDDWGHTFAYRFPYFFGAYVYHDPPPTFELYIQSLDSLANRRFDVNGTLATCISGDIYYITRIVPDDQGGAAAAWQSYYTPDIWAKHVNADGTLGGPVAVSPPPVQHKPLGPVLYASGQSIRFQIASAGEVKLELFDLLGRRVAIMEEGFYTPGSYSIKFNKDDLSSGIYLLRMNTASEEQAIKITVVRQGLTTNT